MYIDVDKNITLILKKGGIGVMPTDTVYGLVGSAFQKKTIERIYKVRKRNKRKPLIILISSLNDLKRFGIDLKKEGYPRENILNIIWPDKITLIFSLPRKVFSKFLFLHRGTRKLAFRLPRNKKLIEILKKTGPLVAPSANIEGEKIASNIKEAKNYFGEKVDFYYGTKKMLGEASTILEWKENNFVLVREGAGDVMIFIAKLLKSSLRKYSNSPTKRIQGAVYLNRLKNKKLIK